MDFEEFNKKKNYLPEESALSYLPINKIGISSNPMEDQLQALKARIFQGASKVELGFAGVGKGSLQGRNTTPELIGKTEREEIKHLAQINNVELTTHATFGIQGFAGFSNEGFTPEQRQKSINEIKRAIDFAADVADGGPVVFHLGEFPRTFTSVGEDKFELYKGEDKKTPYLLVDEETGMLIKNVKGDVKIPIAEIEGYIEKDGKKIVPIYKRDEDGRIKIKHESFNDFLKEHEKEIKEKILQENSNLNTIELNKKIKNEALKIFYKNLLEAEKLKSEGQEFEYDSTFKQVYNLLKDDLKKANNDINKLKEKIIEEAKPKLNEYKQRTQELIKLKQEIQPLLEKRRKLEEEKNKKPDDKKIQEELSKIEEQLNEKEKVMSEIRNKTSDLISSFTQRFGRYITDNPEEIMKIANSENYDKIIQDLVDKRIESYKDRMAYGLSVAAGSRMSSEQIEEQLKRAKPIEEYAIERSAESIAEVARYAMEKSKKTKKPIYIAPENVFAEFYGSHPDEMIKIIKLAREKFKEDLIRKNKISKEEAEKLAEQHIKSTFDIGHLYTWKKHYKGDPNKTLEENEREFNKWVINKVKDLVKSGIIGHVHVSDNFGYEDEHLSPGEGSVPIKDFIKALKEAGLKEDQIDLIVEPAHQDFKAALDAWSYFGKNNLQFSTPAGNIYLNWDDVENSYFDQISRPETAYDAPVSKSKLWDYWTETGLE